jgi:hypothetical protein
MDYEKVKLEDIAIDPELSELTLLRNRGEGKLDRVRRALNTSDSIWYLFNALRDRILEQGAELAELRGLVTPLEGKPRAVKKGKAA